MKKLILLATLGLVAGAFAGCGSSPTGVAPGGSSSAAQGSLQDRADIEAEAARHPEFMDGAVYTSGAAMSNQLPGMNSEISVENAIVPITFTRRVRVTNQQFEFAFSDTDSIGRPRTALLTVHRELTGTFTILAVDTTGGFNDPVRISKPVSENWTRRLLFARLPGRSGGGGDDDDDDGDGDDSKGRALTEGHGKGKGGGKGNGNGNGNGQRPPGGGWQLVAVSGVEIGSPSHVVDVVSIRFEASGIDTTITDPLQLRAVVGLPLLAPQSQVRVTATTGAADDIVVLLTVNRRVRLQPNGDNTYTGTFSVPSSLGNQDFGVSALSHGTLFDDTAPYDSETWLLPIRAGSGALMTGR